MKFAYMNRHGGVSIVHGAPKESLEQMHGPMTDEQYEQHVRARSIPPDANDVVRLPDEWEPPSGRDKRDKWRLVNGEIIVDG